jgi:hypothetical protein
VTRFVVILPDVGFGSITSAAVGTGIEISAVCWSSRPATPSLKIAASPILAFFDELRVFGFVEGQNLKVMAAAMVCATSNFPCIHREPKASSAGGP